MRYLCALGVMAGVQAVEKKITENPGIQDN